MIIGLQSREVQIGFNMEKELMKRFTWFGCRFSLHAFMDLYAYQLPQILVVREGYAGREDELHQFGTDEIYWIMGIETQHRVLLKDKKGRCISLPTGHTSMFQLKKSDGSISKELPLQEALRQCDSKQDYIYFSKNRSVQLYVGADGSHTERLGLLQKHDQYEQRYLLAHTMVEDEVFPERVAIPLYVPITVEVAQGLTSKSKQDFTRFRSTVARIVTEFKETKVSIETGILLFDEVPESDYAYVKPIFEPTTRDRKTGPNRPLPTVPHVPGIAKDKPTSSMHHDATSPWRTVSDIPLNLEDFTLQEVQICVKMLGLNSVASEFSKRFVDGGLLVSLDEQILMDEFQFSRFHARQLNKFINGWRPKS